MGYLNSPLWNMCMVLVKSSQKKAWKYFCCLKDVNYTLS